MADCQPRLVINQLFIAECDDEYMYWGAESVTGSRWDISVARSINTETRLQWDRGNSSLEVICLNNPTVGDIFMQTTSNSLQQTQSLDTSCKCLFLAKMWQFKSCPHASAKYFVHHYRYSVIPSPHLLDNYSPAAPCEELKIFWIVPSWLWKYPLHVFSNETIY